MSEEENNEEIPEGMYDSFKESLDKKKKPGPPYEEPTKFFEDQGVEPEEPEDNKTSDDEKPVEEKSEHQEEKIEVPKDQTFDENPASMDSVMREVMVDTDTVEITESDKRSYIKAVLNDVPVKLNIELCGGAMKATFRSRTSWEQNCMYAAVQKDQDEEVVKDLASVILQLQKYGCALMLQDLNEKTFSRESIEESVSIADAVEKLRKLRVEKIEPLSMPKWGILLNGLRLFEGKLAKMGTECLNGNFWEPVG